MRLFLSVTEGFGDQRDVVVVAPADLPVGRLLDSLGPAAPGPWWADQQLLDPGVPVGETLHDGMLLSRRSPPPPAPAPDASELAEVRVVGGIDAGRAWRLPPGHYTVGRSYEAAIDLLGDVGVSRHHGAVVFDHQSLTVVDEGSSHGLVVDGRRVSKVRLEQGEPVQLGETVLSWVVPDPEERMAVTSDGAGARAFSRPPRIVAPDDAPTIRFPGPRPRRQSNTFPLLASVAPLGIGVLMALVLHNPEYLLFTVLSPVVALGNYLSQRRGGVKSHRARTEVYERLFAQARVQVAEAVQVEAVRDRRAFPDPASVGDVALGHGRRLWERRPSDPDFLLLRLGLAERRASVTIEGFPAADPSEDSPPSLDRELVLHQTPAVTDLARDGVLGIAGDRRACESLAQWCVVQAGVLHAPDDLVATILTGENQEDAWAWARWLPHLRDADDRRLVRIGSVEASTGRLAGELAALVDERLSAPGSTVGRAWSGPAHLVVLDGAHRLGALPAVTRLLRRGPEVGVYCICVEDQERLLPEECRATAVFHAGHSTRLELRTGREAPRREVLADLVAEGWAGRVARALAPLRLNRREGEAATIPSSLRLTDLLGLDPLVPETIIGRWEREGRSTRAVLGQAAPGPLVIDLATDGPHGLVAGTTGSGKSELLQTLIASLAVANRPESMNFVLVDYKGGSAFKDCGELPHTVGMVTDLDGHLTERALASIGAELRRRELRLAESGAKDIEDLWRVAAPTDPPLARLLIVIDEFASLVEELPSFVDGLVDLARRGRSLGIHLILATQRPAGVVSAAIKTNTNLRIAMRVTDSGDSLDVIDSPLAARIAQGLPGRGFLRVGHEQLTEFQAARVGGRRVTVGQDELEVNTVTWEQLGLPPASRPAPQLASEATDLSELVAAARKAAEMVSAATPASPWLPALPERVVLDPETLGGPAWWGGASALAVPYGMEDHPRDQAQVPAVYDVETDGHLLAIGDPGSGRSTFLRTLAAALGAHTSTLDVHLYAIDCGNGALLPLQELPHCGAVVSRTEAGRVDRLMTRLLAEITRRQQLLARDGFATIADQRAAAGVEERLPYIVLLLDRWEGYTAEFEVADAGRLVNSFLHMLREAPGVGVRVVVTGDRSAASTRFASLMDRIVMLRLNDRGTYANVGLNPRHLPDDIEPGRAFHARGGTELQVALLADDPSGPAQVAALRTIATEAQARDHWLPDSALPEPLLVLPPVVARSAVTAKPVAVAERPAPVFLVGIGGDRLQPQQVDLRRIGPGFVVSGAPRTGRSTALLVAARSVIEQGCSVIAVTARPSPLEQLAGVPGVLAVLDGRTATKADADGLLEEAGHGVVVLVDDAELLTEAAVGDSLTAFTRSARDHGNGVVLAGTTGELGAFRGLIPEVRKSKAGLLLCPGAATDGEVIGARLPRTAMFPGPVGRGVLIADGTMRVVQVPFDDSLG